MLLGVAAAFFLAALLCVLIYRRQLIQGGLPTGDLIYSDFSEQEARVLVSRRHGLKGKPDALVRTASGDVIPIQRKKSRAPQRPYAGDLIQATAYCVMIEETYGRTPPFMRIQYADACFDEPYTPDGKNWVLQTCEQVREARRRGLLPICPLRVCEPGFVKPFGTTQS